MSDGQKLYKEIKKAVHPCTAALEPATYEYMLNYIAEPEDQRALREQGEGMELPNMISSADEYQFLGWFLQTMCARKVIEVGVFRGVTTLALARQLPADGVVRALDISAEYADIGKKAWEEAGVADKIDFRIGPAAESMRALLAEEGEAGTYDFVYIDANKDQYTEYYELALNLLRSGGVIAVDNTLFHGLVTKEKLITSNSNVKGVHELNERIRTDSRVSAVMTILADGVYFVRKL